MTDLLQGIAILALAIASILSAKSIRHLNRCAARNHDSLRNLDRTTDSLTETTRSYNRALSEHTRAIRALIKALEKR